MHRFLLSLALGASFSLPAVAQCVGGLLGGVVVTSGDNQITGHIPIGFTFPMAGSTGTGTWTHMRISTNGWLMLTNGVTNSTLVWNPFGGPLWLYEPPGSNPLIAPYMTDLNVNSVWVASGPAVTRVSWYGAYDNNWPGFRTFHAELFPSGEVRMKYQDCTPSDYYATIGLSASNGTVMPAESNLLAGTTVSQVPAMHMVLPLHSTALDQTILTFTPEGNGYRQVLACGMHASHAAYGQGCNAQPGEGFYEEFGTAAQAAAALDGVALRYTIAGNSYAVSRLPALGAFVPPSGNTNWLPTTDDGSHMVTLPYPLPTPSGTVTQLRVSHNGIVHLGSAATSPHDGDYTPTGAEFAASPLPAFHCWHDFNDTEPGSGNICYEQVGTNFYLTWDGVESFAVPETANRSWFQYRFDLLTGEVWLVVASLATNSTMGSGSGYLVGYKGAGVIADPGSVALTTTLPDTFRHAITPPMVLSSSVPPLSTSVYGAPVVFDHQSVPELAGGLRLGCTIVSFGQDLTGTNLAFLGMPACALHVGSLDLLLSFVGTGSTATTTLQLPSGVLSGTRIFTQAAALVPPGPDNTFGVALSNALASTISFR
ncbi:MAG: hypothetical protein JNK15_10390 [Planctomycetes bacterium]|nr:hypothetical protein [Planctomycetota bacterium]